MNKTIRFIGLSVLILILALCSSVPPSIADEKQMTLISSGIEKGMIANQYGMRGTQKRAQIPTLSLPLTIVDAPDGTVCFAVQMTDPDSRPEWVHWLAVNIETAELPENASIDLADSMVQGKNSFGSHGYGGPKPPDRPHTYVITVFALDAKVDLNRNFTWPQFKNVIKGHVIAEASVKGRYRN